MGGGLEMLGENLRLEICEGGYWVKTQEISVDLITQEEHLRLIDIVWTSGK